MNQIQQIDDQSAFSKYFSSLANRHPDPFCKQYQKLTGAQVRKMGQKGIQCPYNGYYRNVFILPQSLKKLDPYHSFCRVLLALILKEIGSFVDTSGRKMGFQPLPVKVKKIE